VALQIKSTSAILIAALALSMSAAAQDQPQTSDESVAKAAQKQKSRKARIVLTDDDLPHHLTTVPDVQPAIQTTQTAQADKVAPSDKPAGINVPDLVVGGSVDDAKNLLDRLHQEEALLIQRFEQIKRDLANTDSAQLRHVYSEALSHREETLARTKKKIADTEQALAAASNGKKEGDTNNAAK